MRQIGRPGARPGPGLGAMGQHGRQQLGQRIGRGGHRRGRGCCCRVPTGGQAGPRRPAGAGPGPGGGHGRPAAGRPPVGNPPGPGAITSGAGPLQLAAQQLEQGASVTSEGGGSAASRGAGHQPAGLRINPGGNVCPLINIAGTSGRPVTDGLRLYGPDRTERSLLNLLCT